MTDDPGLFDIIGTTRSMRRLKPDPVPDELIHKILQAGMCAANGGNTQKWRFLVVKDAAIKKAVQVWYKKAFEEVIGPRYASSAPPPGATAERYQRQHSAVEYLTEHFHEAPVWIVACIDEGPNPPPRWAGASIYPAVQNMLLATRALGLGSTLTTRHLLYETETDGFRRWRACRNRRRTHATTYPAAVFPVRGARSVCGRRLASRRMEGGSDGFRRAPHRSSTPA